MQLLPVRDVDIPGEVAIHLFYEILSHMIISGKEEIIPEKRGKLFYNTFQ